MTLVIALDTGRCYQTYPTEFYDQINFYKEHRDDFAEPFAIFRILDAVYNAREPYSVKVRPIWDWGLAQAVWNYTINSPIINEPIKIKTVSRHLTPTIPMTEDNLNKHKWGLEYQISIRNLYEASFMDNGKDVIIYQCRRFIEPAYEEFMQNGGTKWLDLEEQRKQRLVKLANKVSPYTVQK